MDEGQCFRCGRVPRLCVCPEGPMLEPPPPRERAQDRDDEMKLRSYQRVALAVLRGQVGLGFSAEDIRNACGISIEEAQKLREEFLERFPATRETLASLGLLPKPVVHVHDSIEVEGVPAISEEEAAEVRKRMEDLCPRPFEYGRLSDEVDAEEPTSVQILRGLHEAFENVIIQRETKSQRAARRRAKDFLEALDSPRPMPREAESFLESPRRFAYRFLTAPPESDAIKVGTEIHQALETLLKFGDILPAESDEAVAEKVHFVLRLAKLQANYESNVDEDVTAFLARHGITDIYNVPKKWSEVRWRGKTYLLCELEDEEGIVTPFGLYLDWPAPTPDIKNDPDWNRDSELP